MQKDILKALGENPRVAKELSAYLKGIGIDLNKFVLEDSLPNKLFHFINFSNSLYNLSITFNKDYTTIDKGNIEIANFENSNYTEKITDVIIQLINYCEKPF